MMTLRFQLLLCAAAAVSALPAQAAMNISSAPTKNVTCSAGACVPTSKSATLNVADLQAMLAASDVTVNTGAGAVTIEIIAPLTWSSTHLLTLTADYNVSIKAPVVVEGAGGLNASPNHGAAGGQFLIFPGGRIDFWDTTSSLTVNGTSYVLVNDIASMASAYAADNNVSVALAKDYDAGPDGTYQGAGVTAPMRGSFEGLGHTISNFSVSGNGRRTGLFSQNLNQFSTISDLTLSNVNVTGVSDSLTGALAGAALGVVTNVHSSGRVSAGIESYVGGLTGSGGTFTHSDSSVAVSCSKGCKAGGLAGSAGSISTSHASGAVRVGQMSTAGGLTGFLEGSIVQSYATGDVVSAKRRKPGASGGLAGGVIQDASITDSYALGAVENAGESSVGGLIGYGQANVIKNAYSIGAVGGATAPGHKAPTVGGFVGFSDHAKDYSGAYWDVDTSGTTVGCGDAKPRHRCPSVTGLSDAALKSQLPAGFDPAVWAQSASINNGYPYLIANPPQ